MKTKNRFFVLQVFLISFAFNITSSCKKDVKVKLDPIITWANPADITFPTLLSDLQLNATADVPGSFVYTPEIGQVISIGESINLTVNFNPDDSENYNTAAKTVQINVKTNGTLTDIEGNIYNTVLIDSQIWMVENLKTTRFRNGSSINNINDNTAWNSQAEGAYCWYNNDAANYNNTYGALYNFYAVVDSRNLCPTGWRIPSSEEWSALITYLGGEYDIANKLKAITIWSNPYIGTNNSSGFTALPGGYRGYLGKFEMIGGAGAWWSYSSTEFDATTAWSFLLQSNSFDIVREYSNKRYGFSVRCMKDL